LLALMDLPPQVVPADAWDTGPLSVLPPGDSLRSAEAAVAEQGPAGVGGGLMPVPLPSPLTPLIGRVAEMGAGMAAGMACRLVTVTGTGGAGKTRVALQAARQLAGRFPAGVAFADLAQLDDPELLAVTLAQAVGLGPASPADAEDQLAAALQSARLLLLA